MALSLRIRRRWNLWPLLFYQNLYTRDDTVDPNIIVQEVQHCVDDYMNEGLCKAFS
jgi:hypothetical protein